MLKKIFLLMVLIMGLTFSLSGAAATITRQLQVPVCEGTAQYFLINNESNNNVGVFTTNKINVQSNMPNLFFLRENQGSVIFKNIFNNTSNIMTAIAATKNPETMLCEITFRCECQTTDNGKVCIQFVKTVGANCSTSGEESAQSPLRIIL